MSQADDIVFRCARAADLPAIVALLANDALGAMRESATAPLPPAYQSAFDAIDTDPNHELIVAQSAGGAVIGVLQLSFLPGLSHRGAWRAQIEGVRVDASARAKGVGRQLFSHAIQRARERGCRMVQLTSDKSRSDAIRFYERLGFSATHEGMKMNLPVEPSL